MLKLVGFKVLTLDNSLEWSMLLNRLPLEQRDVYYTPEYYSLYQNLGDGEAKCFVYENKEGIALYPFLMNSVNDLGYKLDVDCYDIQGAYGYNGVVSSSYKDSFIKNFYKNLNNYITNENIISEFTRFHPLMKNVLFSCNNMNVVKDRVTVFIDLSDSYENIFKNFQTTTKKQIRRASDRHNILVSTSQKNDSNVDLIYEIYSESMGRVNAVPYLYFNRDYVAQLLLNTKSTLFIAEYEGKAISFIIALYNDFFLNGHIGGTLTDYIKFSPFSLLYSEMIKWGIANGCRYLHVGGGLTNTLNDPLLQYKMNFSRTTEKFFIGKNIHDKVQYERIVLQWEMKYPEKIAQFGNLLLKYRY